MRSGIFFLSFLLVLASCNGHSELDKALRLSGDNRIELEKVIRHFSQDTSDSLKLKAALFLIENMPGLRLYQIHDAARRRGFSRTGLTDEAVNFAPANLERQVVQRAHGGCLAEIKAV